MIVFAVVALFAVVQSFFGVGLLVFGTPTLLLLGYPFAEILAILLPASMAVSLLQVWRGRVPDRRFIGLFGVWCVVPLVAALAWVVALDLRTSLNLLVALALATFALFRIFPAVGDHAQRWVGRHPRPWLLLMGLVHGVSNLGGALLVVFAAVRHQTKEDIRGLIAFCYTVFAAAQLAVLAILAPAVFTWRQVGYAATAAAVFLVIDHNVFRRVSGPVFDHLLTAFMVTYAGLLGLRAAGII